jgi:hypothetical protein
VFRNVGVAIRSLGKMTLERLLCLLILVSRSQLESRNASERYRRIFAPLFTTSVFGGGAVRSEGQYSVTVGKDRDRNNHVGFP